MKKQIWMFLQSLTLVLFLGITLTACSKKKVVKTNTGETYEVTDEEINEGKASSDNGNALGLRTVNFGLDSYTLNSNAKSILRNNAEILKSNESIQIQIEGHCDERGGIQYNMALGEKRANALKRSLSSMGVSSSRMEVISYGKEQPIAFGSNEDSWSRNRRGNFVITQQ